MVLLSFIYVDLYNVSTLGCICMLVTLSENC